MDPLKVIIVDGKLRLFIDGEEITWEKSLVDNVNSNSTVLDDMKTVKKIESSDDVSDLDVASNNIDNKHNDLNLKEKKCLSFDDVVSYNIENVQDCVNDNLNNTEDNFKIIDKTDFDDADSDNIENEQDCVKDISQNNTEDKLDNINEKNVKGLDVADSNKIENDQDCVKDSLNNTEDKVMNSNGQTDKNVGEIKVDDLASENIENKRKDGSNITENIQNDKPKLENMKNKQNEDSNISEKIQKDKPKLENLKNKRNEDSNITEKIQKDKSKLENIKNKQKGDSNITEKIQKDKPKLENIKNKQKEESNIPENIQKNMQNLEKIDKNLKNKKTDDFANENVNPVKLENNFNKNQEVQIEPTGKNTEEKVLQNSEEDKPIEIIKKKKSKSKKRKNKNKKSDHVEPKMETQIVNPVNDHETVRIKQPRACLQSIIKALSGERQGPNGKSTIFQEKSEGPDVIQIDKIIYIPTLSRTIAVQLLSKNLKESNAFLDKVIEVLGVSKSLELYEKTRIIQECGGLDVKNGSRKRTPGGVFIHILREDKTIKKEDIDNIFKQNSVNHKKLDAKLRHAKSNAEVKEKLQQGGFL